MPTRPYHGLVAVCAVCGQEPELGNDYRPIFKTLKDLREGVQETDGDTLEEKIANNCYGIRLRSFFNCGDIYQHRRCFMKPCGYCRSKRGGWLDELAAAGARLRLVDEKGFWFMMTWWWDIVNEASRIKKAKEDLVRGSGEFA